MISTENLTLTFVSSGDNACLHTKRPLTIRP
jgi:hypothetical protein